MIVIIDYDIGNLGSVKNTLDTLGVDSMISNTRKDIKNASGLILPGVGAASEGMKNLKKRNLDRILMKEMQNGKHFLGICLGMQLLFSYSEEGNTFCLNVIKGVVKKFKTNLKTPQIGWNEVRIENRKGRMENLFKNIKNSSYFYFVHSYYCQPKDNSIITGITDYEINFCSSFQEDNIFGIQFHPEKSGKNGLQLLKNFCAIAYANNTSN